MPIFCRTRLLGRDVGRLRYFAHHSRNRLAASPVREALHAYMDWIAAEPHGIL